jgi:RimJ/RimL family protein N-acetyltransferase
MPNSDLHTPRLLLRRWRAADEAPMAAINRDAEVIRYLNRPVNEAAIRMFFGVVTDHWDRHGFGFYAIESREPALAGQFIGFVGVAYPSFLPQLAQRPELGWRLARHTWRRGLAAEAATAARDDAFVRLDLPELISIIHPENIRSRRLASKLGMDIEGQTYNPILSRDVDIWQARRPSPVERRPEDHPTDADAPRSATGQLATPD